MANLTQTVQSSINFLSPATLWGSPMKWGADSWGNNLAGVGNFTLPTGSTTSHQDFGPILLDLFSVNPRSVGTSNALTFGQGSGQSETLSDGSRRYFYVFGGGFTNDEFVQNPTYIVQTSAAGAWTLSTNSSTSWVIS